MATRPKPKECPHVEVGRRDSDFGFTVYPVNAPMYDEEGEIILGEIARIYTTRHHAQAMAEGLRAHPEICPRCNKGEK